MATTYKEEKEAFVSGMTGSSIGHINLVSLAALASVFLYAAIRTRIPESRKLGFVPSWILLVLPLLLSMTLFANHPALLSVLLLIPGAYLLSRPRQEGPSPLPSKHSSTGDLKPGRLPPLPALTTYRSHMMLMTVLAILAVDFPVFPRSLAKCETYGVSLMDLGVGSFVFSQGMASANALLRDPGYLTAPLWPKLVKVTRKSLPVIALGVARVISVKGTEYPEHVTEYGVHWNFFITLALLPILQVLLHPVIIHLPISLVGVVAALAQQFGLSYLGLKDYVLYAPRTSIFSANKEGIVSLSGYLAIHLLGLSAGTLVLPPNPSYFRRRQKALAEEILRRRMLKKDDDHDISTSKTIVVNPDLDPSAPRQLGKTATELASYSIVWWVLLGLSKLLKVDISSDGSGGVSRRMVNLPYIFWVAAYNVSFVLAYIIVLDIYFFPDLKPKASPKSPAPKAGEDSHFRRYSTVLEGNPPKLLEAINEHGLAIFLVANVLTGVINLSMKTMYASDSMAFFVLSAYASLVCAIAWFWSDFSKSRKT